jgi:hypothetical protein
VVAEVELPQLAGAGCGTLPFEIKQALVSSLHEQPRLTQLPLQRLTLSNRIDTFLLERSFVR